MPDPLTMVRKAFVVRADPQRAARMQAYMKSAMPFHGVPMPEVRRVSKALLGALEFDAFRGLEAVVLALWHGAKFREERYAALVLLRLPKHRKLLTSRALGLYEELISSGAWWDLVDEVATHQLHPLLGSEPEVTAARLRRWSRGTDLWLRRAAIIAQVQAKAATDVRLLLALIEPAIEEREFFLRKAIGWALRALAPYHPSEVKGWLDEHAGRAAGLTRREAEKGLAATRRAM